MSDMKKRGQIVIEVVRDTEFTEDQRTAMIAALEFLFGERPDPHSAAAHRVQPPFGFTMRGMFLQIWGPGSKEEAAGEEMLMRARLEFPIDRSMSPPSYTEEEVRWRQVALEKFREYREIYEAYERGEGHGNSSVALDHREAVLAQMIPYLLGLPEESIEMSKGRHIHKNRPGDPHHHEERLPAYPSEGLEFTGGGEQLPGMWEESDFTGGLDEVRPSVQSCGLVHPHTESCGPTPVPDAFEHKGMKISPSVKKFMRGAEDDDSEYPV